jgi:hypothetical protein
MRKKPGKPKTRKAPTAKRAASKKVAVRVLRRPRAGQRGWRDEGGIQIGP